MSTLRKDSIFGLALGTNGTGKSTRLMEIARASISAGQRVLIIPSNPAEETFKGIPFIKANQVEKFQGIKRIQVFNEKEFVEVCTKLRNCTLISDDFKNYLPKPQLHEDVRRMFINRRHIKVHIYMAAHSWGQVPPEMYNWVNLIMLFKTNDPVARYKHKFMDPEAAIQKQIDINQKAVTDPYYFEILPMQ